MENVLVPREGDRLILFKCGKIRREDLYEMARKYWKLSVKRAENATHALAVVDGIVEAVYVNLQWKYTDEAEYCGRLEFTGTYDVDSEYLGKNVKPFYGRSANPVKYINL